MSTLPLAVVAIVIAALLTAACVGLLVALRRRLPGDSARPAPYGQVPPETRIRVDALLTEGQTIAAIKEVRRATSWSLVDAKNWVDAVARGEQPGSSELDPASLLEVEALAARGDLVTAVRAVRQHTGMSLSEATTYVRGLKRG